jgi:hypothetical protein
MVSALSVSFIRLFLLYSSVSATINKTTTNTSIIATGTYPIQKGGGKGKKQRPQAMHSSRVILANFHNEGVIVFKVGVQRWPMTRVLWPATEARTVLALIRLTPIDI